MATFVTPNVSATWSLLDNKGNDGVIDSIALTNGMQYSLTWSDATHFTALHSNPDLTFGTTFDSQGRPTTVIMETRTALGGALISHDVPLIWQTKGADNVVATANLANALSVKFLDTNGDNTPDQCIVTATSFSNSIEGGPLYTTVFNFTNFSGLNSTNTHLVSPQVQIQSSTDPYLQFTGTITGTSSIPLTIDMASYFMGGTNTQPQPNTYTCTPDKVVGDALVATFTTSEISGTWTWSLLDQRVKDGVIDTIMKADGAGNTSKWFVTWSDATHWNASEEQSVSLGTTLDSAGRPTTMNMGNTGAVNINWLAAKGTDNVVATVTDVSVRNIGPWIINNFNTQFIDTNNDNLPDQFKTQFTGQFMGPIHGSSASVSTTGDVIGWSSNNPSTAPTLVTKTFSSPYDLFSGTITGTSSNPLTITSLLLGGTNTTPTGDITPPIITNFMPTDGATNVPVNSKLFFAFSEQIQKGTGLIEIHSGSVAGTVVASYDVATNSNILVSGNSLVLYPTTSTLVEGTHYFVTIPSGAVKDMAGNSFAGSSVYDFTTQQVVPVPSNTYTLTPDNVVGNALVATFTTPDRSGTCSLLDNKGNDAVIDTMTRVHTYIDVNGVQQTNNIQEYSLTWSDATHFTALRTNVDLAVGTNFDSQGRPTILPFYTHTATGPDVLHEIPIVYQTKGADNVVATASLPNALSVKFLDTNGDNTIDQGIMTALSLDNSIEGGPLYTSVFNVTQWSSLSSTNTHLLPSQVEILSSTDPSVKFSGTITGDNINPVTITLSTQQAGVALDGYLANALVWVDTNDNKIFDAGESNTLTDSKGNFTGLSGTGTIRVAANPNGVTTDISTGKPFTGTFSAPSGSTVINPLTTLVVAAGGDAAKVKTALGLSSTLDLTTYDPFAVANSATATAADKALALTVQSSAAQIANIMDMATTVAKGAGATDTSAISSNVATNLLASAGTGTIPLTDTATISKALTFAAIQSADFAGGSVVTNNTVDITAIAQTLGLVNNNIATTATTGTADVPGSLTNIAHAQIFAHDEVAPSALTAMSGSNTFTSYTQQAVDQGVVQLAAGAGNAPAPSSSGVHTGAVLAGVGALGLLAWAIL